MIHSFVKSYGLIFLLCLILLPVSKAEQHFSDALSSSTRVKVPANISPESFVNKKPVLPGGNLRPLFSPPRFKLPPLKTIPGHKSRLSEKLIVFVREIKLVGVTAFTQGELNTITRQYENRMVSNEELQSLKNQLTRYYIDHGFINSGFILPDQEITNGVVHFQAIEGEMSEFVVEGVSWLRSSYIKDRIAHGFNIPFNVNKVQDKLLQLQQDPLIERINAELLPGLKLGQSRLKVRIEEARPYELGVSIANNRSPSIGGISGQVWLRHRNLTGFGDALFFSYSATDGLDDYFGSYSIPFSSYDTRLNLYYQNSEAYVVEKLITDIFIRSTTESFGVSLSQPFYLSSGQTFTLSLAFEHRRSKTFFNNEPFAFALGVPETGDKTGESRISVFRFTQEWLDQSLSQVVVARSTFNLGVNILGATRNDSLPDGQFFSWLGQFQWVKRIPWLDSLVIFRADAQFSNEPLLPLEKFSVGGMNSVRGYRENLMVRDNGAVGSLELRIPVFRLPIPFLSQTISDGQVQLATFVDYGWSENQGLATPDLKKIGSWGLGVLWDPSPKIHAELYWGLAFDDVDKGLGYDLQDSGIHFSFNAQFF